ncbi:hypothetical protein MMC25_007172 [Agyrium rufum]|nr:hypothetical protein [Agyrium rufum]
MQVILEKATTALNLATSASGASPAMGDSAAGIMLSANSKKMLIKVRQMVPPMLDKFHKGQLGRVAVIGGSQDYTGAPYFSAMASAKLGADLSHVICTPAAATVIKSYSPNLMVHPLMRQSLTDDPRTNSDSHASQIAEPIIEMLGRLHAVVIGPGLGRDPLMQETCALVIEAARKQGVPFVLDADGLMLVQSRPELIQGCKECILTPNVVEFGRLAKAVKVDIPEDPNDEGVCAKVANALGGVLVIQKGYRDVISNGTLSVVCDLEGGKKRSGGQGDTLTGSLATLLAYRKAYLDKIWKVEGDMDDKELLVVAAFGGSALTREASRLAFKAHGRALQASDLTENVPIAFEHLIGEKDDAEEKANL